MYASVGGRDQPQGCWFARLTRKACKTYGSILRAQSVNSHCALNFFPAFIPLMELQVLSLIYPPEAIVRKSSSIFYLHATVVEGALTRCIAG